MKKNNIYTGLILGILFPIIGYFLFDTIGDVLNKTGFMNNTVFSQTWRTRTMALVAICVNLIPLNIFKNKKQLNSMRGVVFPTFAYICYWIYYFKDVFF